MISPILNLEVDLRKLKMIKLRLFPKRSSRSSNHRYGYSGRVRWHLSRFYYKLILMRVLLPSLMTVSTVNKDAWILRHRLEITAGFLVHPGPRTRILALAQYIAV